MQVRKIGPRIASAFRSAPTVVLGLALLLGAFVDLGWARDCGGTRVCRCGNRVTQDYRLATDLGPCKKHGLEIVGTVDFDGGGHLIRGSGIGVGIRLPLEAVGSKVRNVRVAGFEKGVRLQSVQGARIENVEAYRNGNPVTHEGYGIELAKEAARNVISNVRVHDNADEGIHVGAFARDNKIVDSEIWKNYRENVYFLANQGSRLESSRVHTAGAKSANVYIKHSKDSVLEKNRIEDGNLQIRGPCTGTRLIDNTLTGASIVLQPSNDKRFGQGRPSRTTIQGGKIQAKSSCVRADAGSDLVVQGVVLSCTTGVTVDGGSDVTLIDVENTRLRCNGDGGGKRTRSVDVHFVDAKGAPRKGVKIRTSSGRVLGEAGSDGRYRGSIEVARLDCPERDWEKSGDVVVAWGGSEKKIAPEALRGKVALPD